MKKVGLILEGGGTKGIFTAGVLDCLQENGIWLPYVLGVSIGAVNAVDYVSKCIGKTKDSMITDKGDDPLIHWKYRLSRKNMIALDKAFNPSNTQDYFNSDIKSEFVATNCITGEANYLSEPSKYERLLRICNASCSVPYLAEEVIVDGIPYLDGGIADPIPIFHAMELGYEKNIVVLLKEDRYREKDLPVLKICNRLFYQKYPELIKSLDSRIPRYNERLEQLEDLERQGKVFIIRPSKSLIGRISTNNEQMEDCYWQGYFITQDRIKELKKFISQL